MKLSGTINDDQTTIQTSGSINQPGNGQYLFFEDGVISEVFTSENGLSDGNLLANIPVTVESERARIIRERFQLTSVSEGGKGVSGSAKTLKAPMPGMVKSILVEVGSQVTKSTTIMILEAMKMENSITATADGTIRKIFVEAGNSVEKNAMICEIETGK